MILHEHFLLSHKHCSLLHFLGRGWRTGGTRTSFQAPHHSTISPPPWRLQSVEEQSVSTIAASAEGREHLDRLQLMKNLSVPCSKKHPEDDYVHCVYVPSECPERWLWWGGWGGSRGVVQPWPVRPEVGEVQWNKEPLRWWTIAARGKEIHARKHKYWHEFTFEALACTMGSLNVNDTITTTASCTSQIAISHTNRQWITIQNANLNQYLNIFWPQRLHHCLEYGSIAII